MEGILKYAQFHGKFTVFAKFTKILGNYTGSDSKVCYNCFQFQCTANLSSVLYHF